MARLVPDDGPSFAFGDSVILRDDLVLVGDPHNWSLGSAAGAVFGYLREADGSWAPLGRFLEPGGDTNHTFGDSLAMDDGLLLVGAPGSGHQAHGKVWAYVLR